MHFQGSQGQNYSLLSMAAETLVLERQWGDTMGYQQTSTKDIQIFRYLAWGVHGSCKDSYG